jgi:ABC-type transport system substrate-binding protein
MSLKRGRFAVGVAIVAAAAAVLTACGGGGGGSEAASGVPNPDGTLRVTTTNLPPPLDPHTPASENAQASFLPIVYDRLTQMKTVGDHVELAPMVATKWEFSPDGSTLTFTLRDDVTFSDGTKLDASAVKASFERALTLPKSTAKNYLSAIGSVEAPNPTTVVLTTTRPAGDLPYQLSTGFGSIINPKALNNPDLDVNPQGSGPYTVTSYKQGDSITYEKRQGYWDPEAGKAKTIVIRAMPDPNARLSDLRSGGADIAQLQPQQFEPASRLGDNFPVIAYSTLATREQTSINQYRPYLSDVRVRQALNYAIDRQGIIDSILGGHATALTQPLGESEIGHAPDTEQRYTYDPAKAKQLLAEAGVPPGYELTMVSFNYAPVQDVAKVIQAQLGEVGLKVTIEYSDALQAITGFTKDSKYDLSQNVSIAYETPRMSLANTYLTNRTLANPLPPEVVDSLAKAANPTISDAERTSLLQAADKSITDNALAVFIAAENSGFATNGRVIGADTMARTHYQGAYDLRYVGISG